VLAFYLEHVALQQQDLDAQRRLDGLANGAFADFKRTVAAADKAYICQLAEIRTSKAWREACNAIDKQALSQTSVIGFHEKLRLPRTGTKAPVMPNVLWNGGYADALDFPTDPSPAMAVEAKRIWQAEVAALRAKRQASGRGQLTASARRVRSFVDFLESKAFAPVQSVWIKWRARRATLQSALFENEEFKHEIRALYETTYPVTVLVGGPPCQGFSRIGRGKIRSLREALVHVHGDDQAVDTRNLLFQQYVTVLGALRPIVFLFENVQHFQSSVRAHDGSEFQATEVLAEAIANISGGEVSYAVSSRVIDASRHGIPQTRQRYFMCGVLSNARKAKDDIAAQVLAESCLALPRFTEVPLSAALAGLPEPVFVGGDLANEGTNQTISLECGLVGSNSIGRFTKWIHQPPAAPALLPQDTLYFHKLPTPMLPGLPDRMMPLSSVYLDQENGGWTTGLTTHPPLRTCG
jgi:hypothetical protein